MDGVDAEGRDRGGEILGGPCVAELGMDGLDIARLLEVY
jgi:hypothetical protein